MNEKVREIVGRLRKGKISCRNGINIKLMQYGREGLHKRVCALVRKEEMPSE